MAAFIVTLIGLGSLLNNIPASYITARWGERWAIVGAGIWSALGMAICLFASQLVFFAAGCFMVGMSHGVFNLARQSYLTEAVPAFFRARAMSTLGGVLRVGQFVGPFLAAGAVHGWGLGAAFGVGIVAVLFAAVVGWRVPDLKHLTEGNKDASTSMLSIIADHRKVFLTAGVAVLLVSAVRASRQAVIPLWADHIGLEASVASLIYGISSGVEMLLFYPAGRLMDVKGRRWVTIPSMVSMGIGLLLIPFTSGFTTLLLATMLIGVGNGMGAGMIMTLGADYAPRQGRAYFLGLWRLMSDVGASCGPALLSVLAAGLSLGAGIVTIGGVSLVAAGLLYRLTPGESRSHRSG
jgi:MFS family permease